MRAMGTKTVQMLFRTKPARTPEDIGARLATIAKRIQRNLKDGKGINVDDARFLAEKLARYSARLRAPAKIRSTPDDPAFPNIQG